LNAYHVPSAGIAADHMPDGQRFAFWQDETSYTRTYIVDCSHPGAGDDNPGTADRPLMTINAAAAVVQPGERVLVKSGIYRERIEPVHGGSGPDQMIAYEAARGHKVIVSGSQVVLEPWQRSIDPHGEDFSFRLWQVALGDDLFPYEDRPFATPNASNAEIDLMPWALRWKDRVPYTLPRGLVFQDGRRLTQLAAYEDLVRLPGSYWVGPGQAATSPTLLHVHPFDDVNPNMAMFEITSQEQLVCPATEGLGYIRFTGFTFEHAGNGFPRVGTGAVYIKGGHHWIIERNTVRHCNSVGIEAGARINEEQAASPEENAHAAEHSGGFLIRDNTVYDCGTGGIEGHTVRHSLIEGNQIFAIGWQDVERYWECAAIKTLINDHVLVRGNLIHDVASASAIWLDWDNRHCRITQNVVINTLQTHNGAVFIEASQAPNWIDHNIIWHAWRSGITLFDSDQVLVAHNLIAHTAIPVLSKVNTDRSLHGRRLTSRDNVIRNNLFYANGDLPVIEDLDNSCDDNAYAAPFEQPALTGQLNPEWDVHSTALVAYITFDPQSLELTLDFEGPDGLPTPLPPVAPVAGLDVDFHGQLLSGDEVSAGPVQGLGTGPIRLELVSRWR
jgi:alpha-L-arabinofuranosidase